MAASLLSTLLLSALACAAPMYDVDLWTSNATVGMPVNTTSGLLIGHANHDYPKVSEYLGVPFAQPPVQNLRFAPPQPFNGTGTIVAAKQPLSCPQMPSKANFSQPQDFINIAENNGDYANHTSEDCLHLNVWTKYPFPGATLKPVLVWIYGGGFHGGGISDLSEQGAIWSEQQDVVFVSMNYRLGIFGFPGAPNAGKNLGLLDQRLALEWVRDNIIGFGGDPDRIVLFGHSAGGASTDLYNYAWPEDPIIAGSIPMSGNAFSFGNRFENTSATAWFLTSDLIGCGLPNTTSEAAIFACMKAKNATELLDFSVKAGDAVIKTLNQQAQKYAGITGLFGPTIDNITVFENYTLRGKAGAFIQRPIITGSNDDEACLSAERGQTPYSEEDYVTMRVWTCPTYHTAQNRLRVGVPAWQYRYFGAYPNQYANACPGRPWHGAEVTVMFGSTEISTDFNATKKENDEGW